MLVRSATGNCVWMLSMWSAHLETPVCGRANGTGSACLMSAQRLRRTAAAGAFKQGHSQHRHQRHPDWGRCQIHSHRLFRRHPVAVRQIMGSAVGQAAHVHWPIRPSASIYSTWTAHQAPSSVCDRTSGTGSAHRGRHLSQVSQCRLRMARCVRSRQHSWCRRAAACPTTSSAAAPGRRVLLPTGSSAQMRST